MSMDILKTLVTVNIASGSVMGIYVFYKELLYHYSDFFRIALNGSRVES